MFCVTRNLSILMAAFLAPALTVAAEKVKEYNMASQTYTGEVLHRNTKVRATNLNTIRYRYGFASVLTVNPAPALSGVLQTLPTSPSSVAPNQLKGAVATAATDTSGTSSSTVASKRALQDRQSNELLKLHGGVAVSDPFAPIANVIHRGSEARQAYGVMHDDWKRQHDFFEGPIISLSDRVSALQSLQADTNTSISRVTQGKAALVAYLANSRDPSDQLVEDLKVQLTPTSAMQTGASATWADFSDINQVQAALANLVREFAIEASKLSGYALTELPLIQSSRTALIKIQSDLQDAYADFQEHHAPTMKQKAAFDSENQALAALIIEAADDYASLAQLPARVETATTQNSDALSAVSLLLPTSAQYSAFLAAREELSAWRDRMSQAVVQYTAFQADRSKPNPFAIDAKAFCDASAPGGSSNKLILSRVELTPGVANPASVQVLAITIDCATPFVISAGVLFSTIPDFEYETVPTPTVGGVASTTNTIIQTSDSKFHPLPLALVNMRFKDFQKQNVSLYASFGIAANVRSQSAGGSSAEYLIGPSIGLYRTLLVTAGAHIGTEALVGKGYSVGGTVPTTITTVPINTPYTAGFGLGISYSK